MKPWISKKIPQMVLSADQYVASNQFSPSSIKTVVPRQETPVVYLTDWVVQQNADHMVTMT